MDHAVTGTGNEKGARWRHAVTMGVLSGAATLVPIWRIPRGPLVAWGGGAVAVLATAALAMARERVGREAAVQGDPPPPGGLARRLGAPVLAGLAAGAVTAGGRWVSSVTDELSERIVRRLGARRPRLVLAAIATVGTTALEYADAGTEAGGAPTGGRAVESSAKP